MKRPHCGSAADDGGASDAIAIVGDDGAADADAITDGWKPVFSMPSGQSDQLNPAH